MVEGGWLKLLSREIKSGSVEMDRRKTESKARGVALWLCCGVRKGRYIMGEKPMVDGLHDGFDRRKTRTWCEPDESP